MDSTDKDDRWCDSFPKCRFSGVGASKNQKYHDDGSLYSEHENEDRYIHYCIDKKSNTYLYGIFDGQDGNAAADFVSQRMLAELSLGQLENKTSEENIKDIFTEALIAVESAFFESIDPKIAERAQLLEKISDGMSQLEAVQQYPDTVSRLQDLEEDLSSGTTAVVCLLHHGILYVGNVGNSRALLCQKDKSGVLRVRQLTRDHTTSDPEELERLALLSIDTSKIKGANVGASDVTRCFGSYILKENYKNLTNLSSATGEPFICKPYVSSVDIDDSCSFLLLMSDGLFKSYEEATSSEHTNKDIATMVVEQFLEQTTLNGVAQAVVDKVVRLHRDAFVRRHCDISSRDDITFVIRNFNFAFHNQFSSQIQNPVLGPQYDLDLVAGTNGSTSSDDLTLCVNYNKSNPNDDNDDISLIKPAPKLSIDSTSQISASAEDESSPSVFFESTTSTESSKLSNPSLNQLTLDEDGRIKAYVSFDDYYKKIEDAIANESISNSQISFFK